MARAPKQSQFLSESRSRATATARSRAWAAGCAVASLVALVVLIVDPLDLVLTWQTTLTPGTLAYKFWEEPVDQLFIKVYLFNVTNPHAFLNGSQKLRLQQIGPFVYKEVTNFANLTLHGATASFRAERHLEFVPELSLGDPSAYRLTVANLPLLGAAAMLVNAPLVTNLALRSLALFLGAQPLVSVTAHELLWGYDDPLVALAHTVAPSLVDFKRLGLLERMYAAPDDVVVSTGANAGVDSSVPVAAGVYSLQSYNGHAGFPQWGYGVQPRSDPHTGNPLPPALPCDTLTGAFEGVLFPRKVQPWQRMYVYRKQFCRVVPIQFQREGHAEDGLRYFLYHLYLPAFNDSTDIDSTCYCASSAGLDGACLPRGLSSIAPCYYRMPMSLSLPHFMDADPALAAKVEGLNPQYALHHSFFKLQPDMGVPLNIRCRLQMNMMVGHTRLSLTQPFNDMAVPVTWLEMEMDLPERYRWLVRLGVLAGPALQGAAVAALALAAVWAAVQAVLAAREAAREAAALSAAEEPCETD